MKKKRVLSWLLVISMLVTGFALTSCKGDDDDDDDDDYEVSEDDLSPAFGGEVKNYKGAYTILTETDRTKGSAFNVVDVVETDNLGDSAIKTAVQKRNDLIYQNFKTTIKRSPQGDVDEAYSKALEACRSGDDTYDAFCLAVNNGIRLATQDYAVELGEHEYIDFDAEWWDQGVYESLKLAGGTYIAIGDLLTVDKDATWCVLFNKDILEIRGKGLTDIKLYDKVLEGNGVSGGWTLEYMMSQAQNIAVEEEDSSKNIWDPEYDGEGSYGLFTQDQTITALLQSGGFAPTKFNSAEITGIVNNMDDNFDAAVQRLWDNYGKVMDMPWFCRLDDITKNSGLDDPWRDIARGGFKNGRATFFFCHVGTIDLIRDMQSDFGVLPVPKLYDEQTEYSNTIQYNNAHCYVVPRRTENKEDKSVYILEAMAYYSSQEYCDKDSLNYAFYDKVLRGKATRDDKSWEMLDLIFENRVYDLACALNINRIVNSIYSAVRNSGYCNWNTLKDGAQAGFDAAIAKELEALTQAR